MSPLSFGISVELNTSSLNFAELLKQTSQAVRFSLAVTLTCPDPADPQAATALLRIEHLWHNKDHRENSTTYFGDPSPALDDAWAQLMKCMLLSN